MGVSQWLSRHSAKKSYIVIAALGIIVMIGVPNVRSHMRHNATEDLNDTLLELSALPDPLTAKGEYEAALGRANAELDRLVQRGFNEDYLSDAAKAVENYTEAYNCYLRDKVSTKVDGVSESMKGFVFRPDEVYGPAGKMQLSKDRGKKLLAQAAQHAKAFDNR